VKEYAVLSLQKVKQHGIGFSIFKLPASTTTLL